MTSRLKRVLLGATIAVALVAFFWMRSLASWRPVKLGQINPSDNVAMLSSDGTLVVTNDTEGGPGKAVINFQTGKVLGWPDTEEPIAGFSQELPNLAFIVKENDKMRTLQVRDVRSGRLANAFHWITGDTPGLWGRLSSNDSKTVSFVDAPTFYQWDINSGKTVQKVKLDNPLGFVAQRFGHKLPRDFIYRQTPDQKQIVGCTEGRCFTWNSTTGAIINTWTTTNMGDPALISNDARVVVCDYLYLSPDMGQHQSYKFFDTSTGRLLWKSQSGGPTYDVLNDEIFFPIQGNCEVRELLTGHLSRQLPGPRQSDGKILRVTHDWLYTLTPKGEILRWRAR